MKNGKTALVLGATGGIGGEVARRLLAHGWTVRALARHVDGGARDTRMTWIKGDAMNAEQIERAAAGVDVIVHAVNPPGYKNWDQLVLPMIDNTIRAAKAAGARVVLPGTIYNYGSGTNPLLSETTEQRPSTRKGRIRRDLERRLEEASRQGLRALIVRYGDFYGPRPGSNWFSQCLVKPGKPPYIVTYPGKKGVGHSWAYLPDAAETMVRLLEQEERLGTFETFHFGGHWDHDGRQMIEAIKQAAELPHVTVLPLPWTLLKLASPFVRLLREMDEMSYLWREPFQLDNRKLVTFLGEEPRTPLVEAVRQALRGSNSLASSKGQREVVDA